MTNLQSELKSKGFIMAGVSPEGHEVYCQFNRYFVQLRNGIITNSEGKPVNI